ncbi:MAG TPA: permease [Halothiobacillus sp.]|nr:permease [Halothiobacillus sp.]
MSIMTADPDQKYRPEWRAWLLPLAFVVGWVVLYWNLQPTADALMAILPLTPKTHLFDAIGFFVFEVPKVLMLLALITFVAGIVQSFFSPEKTRALLSGRRLGFGNILAALLGIVTPFCSCSAIPLFIGFLTAGVPLGVTFSFLVAAPMVNEVALALLFGLFGWKIALLYLVLGLTVAILAGLVIGRMNAVELVEPWVFEMPAGVGGEQRMTWPQRLAQGWASMNGILWKVAPYILIGVAIGAGIHGYVPQDFMAGLMGRDAWWSVPAAVLIGVPMYSNAAGMVPILQALVAKGAAIGSALAFMMAVTALSLPEFLILRKVMKIRLILMFAGIVAVGIMLVGYVFNVVIR